MTRVKKNYNKSIKMFCCYIGNYYLWVLLKTKTNYNDCTNGLLQEIDF